MALQILKPCDGNCPLCLSKPFCESWNKRPKTINDKYNLFEESDVNKIEANVTPQHYDSQLFLYKFIKMLRDGDITISFKETVKETDKEYLFRLMNEKNEIGGET